VSAVADLSALPLVRGPAAGRDRLRCLRLRKNQARLLEHAVADLFFAEVVELARRHDWVSDDHFSVDGTLIEACASLKSFRPKGSDGPRGGNAWMDFKGEQRRNDTLAPATDPEAKLVKKGPGKEARLSFAGHATIENRHGLCVLFEVRPAVGTPESAAAVDQMIELRNRGFAPKTVGADKGYHTAEFVPGLRAKRSCCIRRARMTRRPCTCC
jgi:hypothetical protein